MQKAVKRLEFGNFFSTWITILYNNDPSLMIKNNAWLSNRIPMLKGITQGSLSALLFILSVECLAVNSWHCHRWTRIENSSVCR